MDTRDASRKVESAYIAKAMTYDAYVQLMADLLAKNQTTGPDQSEAFIHYTQLNQQRMHRIEKLIVLQPEAVALIRSVTVPQTWLVLTEAWCGDAAHSLPVMHALTALNPSIRLLLLLRDENLLLMDRYLTNSVSRSIPKLIALDTMSLEELFTWGPRPAVLQESFMRMKAEGIDHQVMVEEFQRWYNNDKSVSTQHELATLAAGATASVGMTA